LFESLPCCTYIRGFIVVSSFLNSSLLVFYFFLLFCSLSYSLFDFHLLVDAIICHCHNTNLANKQKHQILINFTFFWKNHNEIFTTITFLSVVFLICFHDKQE